MKYPYAILFINNKGAHRFLKCVDLSQAYRLSAGWLIGGRYVEIWELNGKEKPYSRWFPGDYHKISPDMAAKQAIFREVPHEQYVDAVEPDVV